MSPRHRRPSEPTDTFFLDRGLGRHHVAGAIRDAGFTAIHMSDVFDDDGQTVGDDEWIHFVARKGWIALTKDAAIARSHQAALQTSGIRMFALANANITGPEMADRVGKHLNRIRQRAMKPGPYLYVIQQNRVEKRWPR